MLQILSTSNSFQIISLDIYFLVYPGAREPGLCQYTLLKADWFDSLVGIRKNTRPACNGGGGGCCYAVICVGGTVVQGQACITCLSFLDCEAISLNIIHLH